MGNQLKGEYVAINKEDISEIIALAWADDVPFAAIEHQFGLSEAQVIKLMRQSLKPSSFKLWRQRVSGRASKQPRGE